MDCFLGWVQQNRSASTYRNRRTHLERFLQMYQPQDVWHDRAQKALDDIAAHAPLEKREAHFPE